jgi:hypothetical protein
MPNQVEYARPGLSSWLAESLRLTAFPAAVPPPQQLAEWPGWQTALGCPPPNRASREHGQEIREDGPFADSWLSFIRQPARLDWVFHPKAGSIPGEEASLGIGGFVAALPPFEEAMLRWLAVAPPLRRLAFGAALTLPVPDRVAGYRALSDLLPFRLDPTASRDFLYQINRPRPSSVPGVEGMPINRLSKWAVATLTVVLVDGSQEMVRSKGNACRLELDINTPAEHEGALPQPAYGELFRELVEMAREIAARGDVP